MTYKQKQSLLKAIAKAMGKIDAMSDLEYINDYELPVIIDKNTLDDTGYAVVIELNTRLQYDEEMLAEWKRLLNADEWYFRVSQNILYITFKVRYKEG